MNILILGATGYIGSALYKKCISHGYSVIGTSRAQRIDSDFLYFNMGDDIENIEFESVKEKNGNKYAVICAGQSNIALCKANFQIAYQINVIDTKKLIAQLNDKEYKIIFCSTDNVFDGNKGNYIETDVINPINEYGKMKAEIENYLLMKCRDSCIVRLSKVVGNVYSVHDMLKDWKNKALKKETIYCIKDNYFTPVYIDDVVNSIIKIMQYNLTGIYHICGKEEYARIDLCKRFLDELQLSTSIEEKDIEGFNFNDKRPLDTSMSNRKFVNDTGYRFIDLETCFKDYKSNI